MWPNPQISADLVIFIEKILIKNLRILCNDRTVIYSNKKKIHIGMKWVTEAY